MKINKFGRPEFKYLGEDLRPAGLVYDYPDHAVIYHAGCDDGFGAAWAAWKVLGDNAVYIPASYGDPFPEVTASKSITIVDFSYPREDLLGIRSGYEPQVDIVVLDHHKTAQADLEGLPWAVFDMEKSGAMLAWEFFHPNEPNPPMLIEHIQDRDLWKFNYPATEAISACLRSYPQDFHQWELLEMAGMPALASEGTAILRYIKQQVVISGSHAWMAEIGGFEVPIVNTGNFVSEVGHLLNDRYGDAPFAACYYDKSDGTRVYSLRSVGDFDVSDVAKIYGGGGHRNAAGFTVPVKDSKSVPGEGWLTE